MDSILDFKNIPFLETTLTDSDVRKSVRLLCVFGCNGEEVIFATNDDIVFGFGRNRFGGLGLGTDEDGVRVPKMNPHLSYKRVVNIFCGYEHWMALTSNGRCYAWGHNEFGQLGIGSVEATSTPQFISSLSNERIIEMSCGASHSLALTSKGQIYSWGNNKSGLLGRFSESYALKPNKVFRGSAQVFTAISCGRYHSMALSVTGLVYVWGLNNYGQLGMDSKECFICYNPKPIPSLESIVFSKAICGSNYSLLLSTDGKVYAFGDNMCGQVGNGLMDKQFIPHLVRPDIKFKDIVAHKENDISIGLSVGDNYYVWGLVKNRRFLTPQQMGEPSGQSLFDIYAKYAKTKLTFKTIVINEEMNTSEPITEMRAEGKQSVEVKQITQLEQIGDLSQTFGSGGDSISKFKTLDKVLNLKYFPFLDQQLGKQLPFRKNIRLLYIFGARGQNAIFINNKDICFVLGNNRYGCLAMGNTNPIETTLKVNTHLSNRQLIDICSGTEHCLALAANGKCYSWGSNHKGQLGVEHKKICYTPVLIKCMSDRNVIQISCGGFHSMALTAGGQVYVWGHNNCGQLGVGTYSDEWIPVLIHIKEAIISISCGRNHSLAMTGCGIVYVWGNNEFGQLGVPKEHRHKSPLPIPITISKILRSKRLNILFKKAICGSDYCLLLSSDGFIYGFGSNHSGQVGCGPINMKFIPNRITDEIRFKDVITDTQNSLSIGVSMDDKYYIWGSTNNNNYVLSPKLISDSSKESIFNVYAKFASKKTTFKAIVLNNDKTNQLNVLPDQLKEHSSVAEKIETKATIPSTDIEDETLFPSLPIACSAAILYNRDRTESSCVSNDCLSQQSVICDNHSIRSSIVSSNPMNNFHNYVIKSFNNRKNSDFRFSSENRTIYCHKTILQIRCEKFWQILSQQMDDSNQIRISDDKYESFYAFLQYLYGMEPQLNDHMIYDLKSLAEIFDEKELLDDCSQYIEAIENTPNLSTVCSLYEKAIKDNLNDLENSCIEFALNNWKTILRSDEFGAMDDSLSKRLMTSVFLC